MEETWSQLYTAKKIYSSKLTCFLIVPNCPAVQQYCKAYQIQELSAELQKTTAFEYNKAHCTDKVGYRNGIAHLSAPLRHTVYTGEKTAHQKEYHYKEIGDKHSLQLRISISGDQQSEAENCDEVHYRKGV